ncbi:hypothetical protein RhiJN_10217 [Ceratobasidium sp. AG-Ba]|nr:hypothetical protein RhiJN_10217 [Ceratobasidium sp. AG-Ba]QRW10971.1 hypothetical protein RhiLY_09970 [Ceratobasidium sp. AG-Ba]
MSRVHEIQRSPAKKMRLPPKDLPPSLVKSERGIQPWQITEYRQVYCLDRLPDGQLPDTVIHIHVDWVWRTRKLGNLENPPQVLAGDYVWVISNDLGYNTIELGIVKEILHHRDIAEQTIVTELLRHIPLPPALSLSSGDPPTHTRIYPTKYSQIYDMTQGQVRCAGFESYQPQPVIRHVKRSKMELVTNVNAGASWVEVMYIRKDLWAKRLKGLA